MTRPRKPKAVLFISPDMQDALKIALLQERNNILEEFPGYKIIGCGFILSNKAVTELCALAPSLTSADDLSNISTL